MASIWICACMHDFLLYAVPGLTASQLYRRPEKHNGASWEGVWIQTDRFINDTENVFKDLT